MNDEIAKVKKRYEERRSRSRPRSRSAPRASRPGARRTATRSPRTASTKTVALTTGEIGWRLRPPKVVVRGVEAVLDKLKRMGLDRFIRTKEEINKEAILNEPDAVARVPASRSSRARTS
jgi:phage host-nuclease inhibitor protein Gam